MKNIVTIGGGTGSFTLLSGLKKYPVNISAIVTMADDGGSTGKLRDELGVLPPGDVRQCLVALSESSDTLRKLMNYRFMNGGLKGHNFGNLLISALEKIEGDFSSGLKEASKILNIKGEVIPVSEKKMNLAIELGNHLCVLGENQLDHNKDVRKHGVKKISLRPGVKTNQCAIQRVLKADLIVIGPGDHYGSIVPNLLTDGLTRAINRSHGRVVYICNLTNKKGQTSGYTLDDYANAINMYFKRDRIDYCLVPDSRPSDDLRKKYERREGSGSVVDFSVISKEDRSYDIVKAMVLKNKKVSRQKNDSSFIRHDSAKLAKAIMEILEIDDKRVIKKII